MLAGQSRPIGRPGEISATPAQADWRSTLARSGLTAKGILYAALGILTIQIAAGDTPTQSASSRGAIELVASQTFGQWLLGFLTFGLFALAVWQVVLAWKGDPVEGSAAKDRAKYAGKAAIYAATAATALTILLSRFGGGQAGGARQSAGGATEDQAAAAVMTWPGGPWIVGLIGAAVIGAAIYQLHQHAWHRIFMQRLNRLRMSPTVASGVESAGRVGYAARGIVLAIIGTFFIVAAVQHDPQEALGLSGALQLMSREEWGQMLLWTVAIGLFLYGCFCFAEAKYRRAT